VEAGSPLGPRFHQEWGGVRAENREHFSWPRPWKARPGRSDRPRL